MRLAEFVTETDEDGKPKEWLTLDHRDGFVSIKRDYLSALDGERHTWCDEGITIEDDIVPAVIAALEKATRTT